MKKKVNIILWIGLAVLLTMSFLTNYILLSQRDELKKEIKDTVRSQVEQITIPVPKDGKNASMEQVRQAVTEYIAANPPKDGLNGRDATQEQIAKSVNEYFAKNPVKQPKDGKTPVKGIDFSDGVTPQIRCNAEANRWEARFSSLDNWQLLNGEKVKCTTEVQP